MKKVLVILLALSLVVGLVGCSANKSNSEPQSSIQTFAQETKKPSEQVEKEGLVIAMLLGNTANQYFQAEYQGALDYAEEVGEKYGGITIQYLGTVAGNAGIEEQIGQYENAIAGGVDGIITFPVSSDSCIDPLNKAVEAGIPVVVINNQLTDMANMVSFVGTNAVNMTASMSDYMIENVLPDTGTFVEFVPRIELKQQKDRYDGFVTPLKEKTAWKDGGLFAPDSTIDSAMSFAENLIAGGKADLIWGSSDSQGAGIMHAIEQANVIGKVYGCSVDCNLEMLKGIRSGALSACVLQMPYYEGYYGMQYLLDHLDGKEVPKELDVGSFLITPDNIDTADAIKAIQQYLPDYTGK